MRITHTQLQECLANPAKWYQAALTAESHPYLMGYKRVLRLAVSHFHRTNADEARHHLERLIRRHKLSNVERLSEIEAGLDKYIAWASKEGVKVADTNVNLQFQLGFLELRGQVGRVDATSSGYRAVLFGRAPQDWEQQLRMPLIQTGIASMYGRPQNEFEVGFQQLDSRNLATRIYAEKEIKQAEEEFRKLGDVLQRLEKARKARGPSKS